MKIAVALFLIFLVQTETAIFAQESVASNSCKTYVECLTLDNGSPKCPDPGYEGCLNRSVDGLSVCYSPSK